MKIGIPKEIFPGETRVAATPNSVKQLKKLGFDVLRDSFAIIGYFYDYIISLFFRA